MIEIITQQKERPSYSNRACVVTLSRLIYDYFMLLRTYVCVRYMTLFGE